MNGGNFTSWTRISEFKYCGWVSEVQAMYSDLPFWIIWGRQRGSLTVEDHFRSILGIICGRGSFKFCTIVNSTSGKYAHFCLKESLKERRFDIIVVVAQSLTNVAGSSFEFDNSSLSFWSVNNSLLVTIQFVSFQPFLSIDRHVTVLEMRSTR